MDKKYEAMHLLRTQAGAFVETLAGLKELADQLIPHANELDAQNSSYQKVLATVARRLPDESVPTFYATMILATPIVLIMSRKDSLTSTTNKAEDEGGSEGEEVNPLDYFHEDIYWRPRIATRNNRSLYFICLRRGPRGNSRGVLNGIKFQ